MRDRDSPVEWTGEAHLVKRTCEVCGDSHEVPEMTAEHQFENDIPPICEDCRAKVEDLWSDMYIRDQSDRLYALAEYVEAYGYYVKSEQLRHVARTMELYEPVIRGIEQQRDNGSLKDREALSKTIERLEEV